MVFDPNRDGVKPYKTNPNITTTSMTESPKRCYTCEINSTSKSLSRLKERNHDTERNLQAKTGRAKKLYKFLAYALTAVLVLAIIAAIVYFLARPADPAPAKGLRLPRGVVVTNGHDCALIGASVLHKGGSAVDAAVAALFCEGVSMPQSMGVGGGFLMTVYSKGGGAAETLNARETAPAAATEDMFAGNGSLSARGGLAVAVPGELRGYWEAHRKYGRLPWKELVQPTIDLCRNGILVTEYLERLFANQEELLKSDEGLREAFIDPTTNHTYKQNQFVKRLRLAKTLEIIAEEGVDALYNGSLTAGFIQDIKAKGGIITEEDMKNYKVKWVDPIVVEMPNNQVLYTSPLPGSGVILSFIMNILNGFLDHNEPHSVTNWQRIVESFKYGYGKRTELGDMDFVDVKNLVNDLTSPSYAKDVRKHIFDNETFQDPRHYGANTTAVEDHGTAHISVLAANGDAVSVTSTINLYFGAGFMSKSTGIILNDEMDDFSAPNIINHFNMPPSPANYIKPGKRPLSSMCPSIVVNKTDGHVNLVVGAAGGTKITTSVSQITIKNLWFKVPITQAVQEKRLHHQLFPMKVQFEDPFKKDMDFVNALHTIGHEFEISEPGTGFSAVTSIAREEGVIRAATDHRRSGNVAFVY